MSGSVFPEKLPPKYLGVTGQDPLRAPLFRECWGETVPRCIPARSKSCETHETAVSWLNFSSRVGKHPSIQCLFSTNHPPYTWYWHHGFVTGQSLTYQDWAHCRVPSVAITLWEEPRGLIGRNHSLKWQLTYPHTQGYKTIAFPD